MGDWKRGTPLGMDRYPKTHMHSAVKGREHTLCGVKVPEGTELESNPSGKPTCKRCIQIIENNPIMDETDAKNHAMSIVCKDW